MSRHVPAAVEEGRTSYTALTLHRTCPQAWSYRFLRGLTPLTRETVDADLGSWWHALRAADSIERGLSRGSLMWSPQQIRTGDGGPVLTRDPADHGKYRVSDSQEYLAINGEAILSLMADRWWASLPGDERDLWTERCAGPPWELLSAMNGRWYERWADRIIHEAPVGVEVQWSRVLPGTDNQGSLRGTVDEIYLDHSRGGLIVARDHKTHRILKPDAEEDLMDSQLHLYGWGVSPTVREWLGNPVQAIAYDRVRSNPPKEPKVTQSGGLSKSVTDYDVGTYLGWAAGPDGTGQPYPGRKKDGSEAGLYAAEDTVIEKLSRPTSRDQWTQRTLSPLSMNTVTAHVQASIQTWRDSRATVERWQQRGEAPRNFTRYGCRVCDFSDLCRAEMIGGPDGDYALAELGLRHK